MCVGEVVWVAPRLLCCPSCLSILRRELLDWTSAPRYRLLPVCRRPRHRPPPPLVPLPSRSSSQVLRGMRLVFTRVIPLEMEPTSHPLWRMAESFGARCSTLLDAATTHVVAGASGTEKVLQVRQRGECRGGAGRWAGRRAAGMGRRLSWPVNIERYCCSACRRFAWGAPPSPCSLLVPSQCLCSSRPCCRRVLRASGWSPPLGSSAPVCCGSGPARSAS